MKAREGGTNNKRRSKHGAIEASLYMIMLRELGTLTKDLTGQFIWLDLISTIAGHDLMLCRSCGLARRLADGRMNTHPSPSCQGPSAISYSQSKPNPLGLQRNATACSLSHRHVAGRPAAALLFDTPWERETDACIRIQTDPGYLHDRFRITESTWLPWDTLVACLHLLLKPREVRDQTSKRANVERGSIGPYKANGPLVGISQKFMFCFRQETLRGAARNSRAEKPDQEGWWVHHISTAVISRSMQPRLINTLPRTGS